MRAGVAVHQLRGEVLRAVRRSSQTVARVGADAVGDQRQPIAFIQAAPLMMLSTIDSEGFPTLSPKGDGAGFVGPGLAGVLIAVANAPLALVADAASFVASFVSLRAIRTVEPPAPRRRAGHRMVDDIRAGALAIWRRPTLRLITLEAISGNVAFSIMIGQSVIYQRLDLGFGPALIGAISSIGFLGGAVGGLAAPHLLRRVGFGRLLLVATILFGLDEFVQPLASVAPSALAFPLVAANFFFGGLFLALWVVPVVSYRATVIPDALRGRERRGREGDDRQTAEQQDHHHGEEAHEVGRDARCLAERREQICADGEDGRHHHEHQFLIASA